ncbi:heterokaryon incompatibility protein-domain-containing protein [Bisporella sp. PMI_857]|nr:heterokaryon incompatibility protein-domain-containing protein [Bisporella sp. PMI_857]
MSAAVVLATFQYSPLSHKEIRLIRLSSSNNKKIETEIQTFPLEQCPQYTALSYMWGDPSRINPIMANGKQLGATKSLHIFFQELKSRSEDFFETNTSNFLTRGWFWIDAVCINQDDVVERSEQITRMKEIYEEAHDIVIWLGEGNYDRYIAMEFLVQLSDFTKKNFVSEETRFRLRKSNFSDDLLILEGPRDWIETSTEDWIFLSNFLNLEYWNRSWILQEASTPKHSSSGFDQGTTWLFCGSKTLLWIQVYRVNGMLQELAVWDSQSTRCFDFEDIFSRNIGTVEYIEDRRKAKPFYNPLYSALTQSRYFKTTDPKDKLYSVLALSNEVDDMSLAPDYTLTVEAIYTNLAVALIEINQSFDCLGSAGLTRDHDVPSWVPDWAVQPHRIPQPFYQFRHRWNDDGSLKSKSNVYSTTSAVPFEFVFSQGKRMLTVLGFVLDYVTQVSLPHLWQQESIEDAWNSWVLTSNPSDGLYVEGGSRLDAFASTLRADIDRVFGDESADRGSRVEGFVGVEKNAFKLHNSVINAMTWNRRLFVSEKGYIGISSSTMETGDVICVIFGSQMPLILRAKSNYWELVGQAYVHGIMDGQMDQSSSATRNIRSFEIM